MSRKNEGADKQQGTAHLAIHMRRIRVVSPVGRFAGSFRPGTFRPCFRGGSIRPYNVSRFARRSFRPWDVSPVVFIEGQTDSKQLMNERTRES